MRIVGTTIVRDEADIIGAQIAYHLDAGVDFVIATDHQSVDGTSEILEEFSRQGVLERIPVVGEVDEIAWRTRMARAAATDHGADWVIAADADEFWLPRYGTIRETLAAVPPEYGVVGGLIRHFVPRPDDSRPFYERMTIRLVQHAPVNDPVSPWRPSPKVVHRADPTAAVLHAGYWVESARLTALPGWNLFDVLHFPCRSVEQWARKTSRRGHVDSDKPLGQYVKGLAAGEAGRIEDVFRALAVDERQLELGLAAGCLVEDRRLRDVLRLLHPSGEIGAGRSPRTPRTTPTLGSTVPSIDALVEAAAESTALFESMLVRFQRRIDDSSARLLAASAFPGVRRGSWRRPRRKGFR